MNKKLLVILVVIIGLFTFASLTKAFQPNNQPTERKIVVFKSGVSDESVKDSLLSRFEALKNKDLRLINGRSIFLSKRNADLLAKDPNVLRIDDDVEVSALARVQIQSQTLPWGIQKIQANLVWPTGNTADPIKVGVIDTGISSTHPDLFANIKGGVNTINSRKSWNDDNGHGSHVAGIIAALNNNIGVVGVGPKIDLYAIKVLDASGSGYLSDVIEGLDWAIQNKMQFVNMSLGTTANIQSFSDAVKRVNAAGIVEVAAAGNDGKAVNFPAAYPEVIAVGATDSNNNIASWSSRGPELDLVAPGVSIYSTYKNSSYATLSGTSMATPHITGTAALVLSTPVGSYDANGNGKWDPSEVQKKLENSATDLGASGFDQIFGFGLINALKATQ